MMRAILTALAIQVSLGAAAQTADDKSRAQPLQKEIYTFVDLMPEFPGDLNSYLGEKIFYPQSARDSNIEGRVVVKFVVDENGAITSPEIVRSAGQPLDEEALRVIRAMPSWKPAKLNGKSVNSYFTLPITFNLQ